MHGTAPRCSTGSGSPPPTSAATPTLIVQAADSPPRFHDACAVVADLLANAETTTLVGVSHLMPLQDPAGLGRVIAEFVGRVCRS
jgi:pimeloyl-ACP methyl ester carboxylesterase